MVSLAPVHAYTVYMVNGYGKTYAEQGRIYLAQAYEELEQGDLSQAAEKGWGAAAQLVKAAADERGLPHNTHGSLFRAVGVLTDESGDDAIRRGFDSASSLHVNYYEGGATKVNIRASLQDVEALIETIEGMMNGRNGATTP